MTEEESRFREYRFKDGVRFVVPPVKTFDYDGSSVKPLETRCPECHKLIEWPRKDGLPFCPECGGKIGDW